MTTLLILDYCAEILHLLYILTTALFRLLVKGAVVCFILGQTARIYYDSLTELSFEISPVDANLQAYLGGTRQLSHPAMIRS